MKQIQGPRQSFPPVRMRLVCWFVVLLSLVFSPHIAAERQEPDFGWAGEQFIYSLRMNGIEAVRAGVRIGGVRYRKNTPYVAVSGTAKSTGFLDSIYPIDNRVHTFIDPDSLRPIRSEKAFQEAGKVRGYDVDYLHRGYRARVKKTRGERSRKFVYPIPGNTHDMMTWILDLRSRQDLRPGKKLEFFVYDGWKLSKLTGVVRDGGEVDTPSGRFPTWRVDIVREIMVPKSVKKSEPTLTLRSPKRQRATLWLTNDSKRLPAKVSMQTKWGMAEAVLMRYRPGKTI